MIKVAPSILSADFSRLAEDINSVSTADYVHVDVMDNHFVPNLTIGAPVVKSLRGATDMVLDVHLMITDPVKWVESYCKAGADIVTVHVEAGTESEITDALKIIRTCGKKAGLSLKPATPACALKPFLELTDMILVMTVEPGFGGQSFMDDQLDKIREIRSMADIPVEVDGGINRETGKMCVEAGAEILVAGSYVFKADNRKHAIESLRCV